MSEREFITETFAAMKANARIGDNVAEILRHVTNPDILSDFYTELKEYRAQEKIQRLPKLQYNVLIRGIVSNEKTQGELLYSLLTDESAVRTEGLEHLHRLPANKAKDVLRHALKDQAIGPYYQVKMSEMDQSVVDEWFDILKSKYEAGDGSNASRAIELLVHQAAPLNKLSTTQLEWFTNLDTQLMYYSQTISAMIASKYCPSWMIEYLIGKSNKLPDTPFAKKNFAYITGNNYWRDSLKEQAYRSPIVPMSDIVDLIDTGTEFSEPLARAVVERSDLTAEVYNRLLNLFEIQKYMGKNIENRIDLLINGASNAVDLTQDQFDRCFDLINTFTSISRSYRSDNPVVKLFQSPLLNSSHIEKTSDIMLAYMIAGTSYWPDRKAELVGMKTVIESGKISPGQLIAWMDKIKNSPEVKKAGKRVSYTQSDLFDKLTGYILEDYKQITPELLSYLVKNILTFTKTFEKLCNHPLTPIKDIKPKTKYKNEKVAAIALAAIEARTNASPDTSTGDKQLQLVVSK